MAEKLDPNDDIKALKRGWANQILEEIPRDLLLDLSVQFDKMPLVTDNLIKENGKITTEDVLNELDKQLIIDNINDKPISVKYTDKLYRKNRGRIKRLLNQFYPDTGRINQGFALPEIILDFIKTTSK